MKVICPACEGDGRQRPFPTILTSPCLTCNGTGSLTCDHGEGG